jgi:hypothetical protein
MLAEPMMAMPAKASGQDRRSNLAKCRSLTVVDNHDLMVGISGKIRTDTRARWAVTADLAVNIDLLGAQDSTLKLAPPP